MKGKLIVFLKSFILAFVCAIVLEFIGLINVSQMLNIALPGFFLVISFILLAKFRLKEQEEKKGNEKNKK